MNIVLVSVTERTHEIGLRKAFGARRRDILPENAVLVADAGYASIWTATMVRLSHAGETYLRAAGSLGWAFPAALGAQMPAVVEVITGLRYRAPEP